MAEKRDNVGGRVAVVWSRYNGSVTERLLEGALAAHAARRPGVDAPEVVGAPGTFELPALCAAAARSGRFAGVLALGCVIKGETSHDVYIAQAVANALAAMPGQLGVPVAFGVLTVDSPEQAAARAGGAKGNKGAESMEALLETVEAIVGLESGAGSEAGAARPDKTGAGAH